MKRANGACLEPMINSMNDDLFWQLRLQNPHTENH